MKLDLSTLGNIVIGGLFKVDHQVLKRSFLPKRVVGIDLDLDDYWFFNKCYKTFNKKPQFLENTPSSLVLLLHNLTYDVGLYRA
ncbi:hypothetical protein KJ664_01630 [Patescibacteria group bacterium]|nr:hypothetical protein [Patescibacteria group bacterium]